MRFTSELAASALKLKPLGEPHTGEQCNCAFCGRLLVPGDCVSRMVLAKTFTDFHSIGSSNVICGFCAATTESQPIMRALQRVVITRDGLYPMGTDQARAWLWLTPPEPPFSVVINHSTLACFHYFWRTPVTTSVDLIQVNVDDAILQVHRPRVLKALEHAKMLVDKANVAGQKKGLINTPFELLDRTATSGPMHNHGALRRSCLALAAGDKDSATAVRYLSDLNMAELFALSSILKGSPQPPVQPQLIRSFEEAKQLAKESALKKAQELLTNASARANQPVTTGEGEPSAD